MQFFQSPFLFENGKKASQTVKFQPFATLCILCLNLNAYFKYTIFYFKLVVEALREILSANLIKGM